MALDTYDDLQASVIRYAVRSGDDDFEESVPDFIKLAHKRIMRNLRIADMETRVQGTPDSDGEIALPDDFLEMRSVFANTGSGIALTLVSPDFAEGHFGNHSGNPNSYTITGTTLKTYPITTSELEMVYYADPGELSDDAPTNWLLTKAPELYLYGSLIEAAPFMMDDQRALTWGTLYEKALNDLIQSDKRGRWHRISGRVKGVTP
jgi:hypothetical protein